MCVCVCARWLFLSFFYFRSFVFVFLFVRSFVRSFVPSPFIPSFVPSSFIPMYILIPLSHFVTCSFIFFLKSSLWIIIHHFSLISIHPFIHSQSQCYLTHCYPHRFSLQNPIFPVVFVLPPPFFRKKKCKLLYYLRPAIWPLTLLYFGVFPCLDLYISMYIYIDIDIVVSFVFSFFLYI